MEGDRDRALRALREEAFQANMEIPLRGLAIYTFGNASAYNPELGLLAIKPSGVDYDKLSPDSMIVLDLEGKIVAGSGRPSSDTPTHRALYAAFPGIGGVVHTHSTYATAWAQAQMPLPMLGTTHADHAPLDIPCTPCLSPAEVAKDYEWETGQVIHRAFAAIDPAHCQMVLVGGHGPFTWGKDAAKAIYNAVVLENLAKMAYISLGINPQAERLPRHIASKHFERKHGKNAYYGQA